MSMNDDDADIIAAARAGFLDEATDMLQQFEQALLIMETSPDDAENLNAAFRAAHTIKGTAGLFGCDAVVAFTHEVETLLEAMRSGELKVNDAISAALLAGRDQMAALMAEVRSGQTDPAVAACSISLGDELRSLRHGGDPTAGAATAVGSGAATKNTATPSAATAASTSTDEVSGAPLWHLSIRFGSDALRNGLDPLAFLRYLGSLGNVAACQTLVDAVPSIERLDAESCHLGFELQLRTDQPRDEIERVFEFAMDDCALTILGPNPDAGAYIGLLAERSGDDDDAAHALKAVWAAQGVDLDALLGQAASDATSNASPENLRGEDKSTPADTTAAERRAAEDDRRQAEERRVVATDRRTDRKPRAAAQPQFVKVRADKLDHLIDLIGELVIAGSGAQMVANQEGSPSFLEATQRVSELVQATRDGALALRMVPVGETFSRFQRVVRDTSKLLGKDIELVITGGDTELDKSMVDVIGDPLMHLVRNSLDHGIETPAERIASGKSGTGRLGLNAYHEGGSIVIEVTDDGRGLDRERILRKAIERGLVSEGAVMSDAEVWQLIFAAGFSTADKVTEISGRGVGMDVVRRNVESLRGQISLVSTHGKGTTTQVRLPLTLAMIDGFLTMVSGVHYVLPLSVVSECIDVPRECRDDPTRACGTFDLRGEVLPYLDLALFYGADTVQAGRRSLVVVREGSVRVGLVVDRLLGEHQTVIKPLAGIFKPLEALAGSTILGSGDVALVLDMQGLMAAALRPGATSRRGERPTGLPAPADLHTHHVPATASTRHLANSAARS
jgi:two-component system chemotaxis sensor kinase CheA